jgi:exodeoxyribonuclease-3
VDHLAQLQQAGNWVDITRQDIPQGLLYIRWSHRAADRDTADRWRRRHNNWATPDIAGAAHGSRILRPARGWDQPSDQVPVFASFDP